MVDQQGLTTWKVDTKAMVQAAGGRWRPLKDLLAMQEKAAQYAAQGDAPVPAASPSTVLPLVPPPPRDVKLRPPTPPAPPPPTPPPSSARRKVVAPPPVFQPPPVLEPTPIVEPMPVVAEAPVLEPPAPLVVEPAPIPVAPEEPRIPDVGLAAPDLAIDEGPPIVPADFREDELAPVGGPLVQAEAQPVEPAIAEPAAPQAWADDAADEPAIFNSASEAVAASEAIVADEDEVQSSLPEPGPEPTTTTGAWDPEPSQWSDAVEAPAVAARRSSVQSLADDPGAPAPYAGASPTGGARKYTSTPSEGQDDAYKPYFSSTEPGFEGETEDDELLKPRPIVLDERFVKALSVFGAFLSQAIDYLGGVFGWLGAKVTAFREARAERAASKAAAAAAAAPPPQDEWPAIVTAEPPPPPQIETQTLADDVSEVSEPAAPEPVRFTTPTRLTPIEEAPIVPLKPLDEEKPGALIAVGDAVRRAGAQVSGWVGALRHRTEELVHSRREATTSRAAEIADSTPRYESGYEPRYEEAPYYDAPRTGTPRYEPRREPRPDPIKPPPTTNEIPVLRLAKIEEVEEPEDIYEGPTASEYFPTVWLWTKRAVLTGVLVAGAFLAYQRWEDWFPKATNLGTAAVSEVTRYVDTRDQKERERKALAEATEQLPHLAPETVQLVLSHNTSQVPPDPPEVFQAACNATDRGLAALTDNEKEELTTLRRELLHGLSPAERERVNEYDEVRSRRTPFAFEDKTALELVARGARGMQPESRERFQTLVGKAIASDLAGQTKPPAVPVKR
jgi:hypothetical protein